jgi:hypothetical protein
MVEFARAGSQRWLQVAIDRRPALLVAALRRSGALAKSAEVEWRSPLREEDFKEYRDSKALARANVSALRRGLTSFWPARGPVWDAIGVTAAGAIFVEAKAHIPEAASPPSRASAASLQLITGSLSEARRWYASKATAAWDGLFYQYANRLAHHYFLRKVNGVAAVLVFLYFLNDRDMDGPTTEAEWRGASRLIRAALGLPAHLDEFGVHDAYLDVRNLVDAV